MKLPKNFGGQGFGGMMKQMQDAMERARTLEEELGNERIGVDKGPVKALFDGTGQMLKISIDPSVVDPDDIEMLEDLVVTAVREALEKAQQIREEKLGGVTQGLQGMKIPGLPF